MVSVVTIYIISEKCIVQHLWFMLIVSYYDHPVVRVSY